jgi:hypothetical protein
VVEVITMKDQAPQREALIEHLQASLALPEELSQPTTGYLIKCAIDEAHANTWRFDPALKSYRRPKP